MAFDDLDKEQKIMVTMRKVLSAIIRDTTPAQGHPHPLTADTIEDVRLALRLISAREQELATAKGIKNTAKPRYADEPKTSHKVSFIKKP